MAKLAYHVLYNQDCTNLFYITKEPLAPAHVDRMVDEVADGGADVLLVNPNAQRVNYPSRAWQTFWDGLDGGDAFFGPVPAADVPARRHFVEQMKRLADSGCDYLARALARCRQRKIAPGVSVRMNDMHDVPWPGSHLFSGFYCGHLELRLSNPPACGWSAAGLNYEHPAVREHYLRLIREIVEGYDLEMLELDFLRFTSYFPRRDFALHCATMTEFVREVRRLTAARKIALVPRVATSPAAAYELGFDVAAWGREGLIDGLTFGAFFNTAWNMPVDAFRSAAGGGVALYACTDHLGDRREKLPARPLPIDTELLRGFAAGYLAAGADGVCTFNFFCPREGALPQDPAFAALGGLGRLDAVRAGPRRHVLSAGVTVAETDGAMQVPIPLACRQTRAFEMLLAGPPAGASATVEVAMEGQAAPADLWLHVNSLPVGAARDVARVASTAVAPVAGAAAIASASPLCIATFSVPSQSLRDGYNVLALRNEGPAVTVLGVDVCVG